MNVPITQRYAIIITGLGSIIPGKILAIVPVVRTVTDREEEPLYTAEERIHRVLDWMALSSPLTVDPQIMAGQNQ
jgi:hypothetical protein